MPRRTSSLYPFFVLQVFSESANAKLDTAVSYFGQLDENLANAGDIYAVKDEVGGFVFFHLPGQALLFDWSKNELSCI